MKKENDLWRYQKEREEARRLQGAGKLRKEEEMTWEPPRNKLDWPDWEEARRKEESVWRLEPEKKTEVPETFLSVSDVVEGTDVDPKGKGHHGQAKAKNSQKSKWRARRGR